jgi:hypothetical protein
MAWLTAVPQVFVEKPSETARSARVAAETWVRISLRHSSLVVFDHPRRPPHLPLDPPEAPQVGALVVG